jgi:hypothetical protein
VRRTEPRLARNVVNSVCWMPWPTRGRFPRTAATTISTRATDTPMRMLISDAARAIPIQTAATA